MVMQSSEQFKILLINSPLVNPSFPPLAPARVAGCLAASKVRLEQYDANLDFFQSQIMSSEQLGVLLSRIKKRMQNGEYNNADSDIQFLLSNLIKDNEKWRYIIKSADEFQDIFKTDKFYKPDMYCKIISNIKKQFELFSMAYYPCFIQWHGWDGAQVQQVEKADAFLKNPDINPFLTLCRNKFAEKLKNQDIKLILIFAPTHSQISAALTIAAFCKQHLPQVHLSIMGDLPMIKTHRKFIEKIIPKTNYSELFEFIAKLGGNIHPDYSAEPDFAGFDLKKYYAPSLVLPFSVLSVRDSKIMPSEYVAKLIIKQAKSYEAKGFVCENDILTTDYIYDLSNKISRSFSGIDLAVASIPDMPGPSTTKEFIHQPCIKLIKWQVPETQKNQLVKCLLSFSKSGIWNHVDLIDFNHRKSNKELLKQVVSNPNIIHSWKIYSFNELSFFGAKDLANMSTSYSKVSNLPGYPLWYDLKDPAHMLLYIKKYGVKKIIRMRTRENGNFVYMLGQNLEYYFVKPSELPQGYLDEICRMVEAGASVGNKWIRYNLEKAFLIAYVKEAGIIIGNSCLKRPRPEYIKAVNQQSGLDLSEHLERGYTSVRPEYRGLGVGTKLLEGLTARTGGRKIFSVIGEDNIATKIIAVRNKTEQIASFYSKRMGKQIGIWMPKWMIED